MTDSFTMPIERGKVREFAHATGSSAPEYLSDLAPPVPPAFLRSAAFWEPEEELKAATDGPNLNMSRMLHGEQEYEFFGPPPRAGTELVVKPRLESVTEKQGRRGA